MVIANRIISILVLLAAITALMLAYVLFKKQEQMLTGWENIRASIQSTARELDANSGTELEKKFVIDNLKHTLKPDAIKAIMADLPAGAKTVIAQRDSLADSLNKTGYTIAEEDPQKTADLKLVDKSKASQDAIVDIAQKTRERDDAIMKFYVNDGRLLEVSTTTGDLKIKGASDYSAKIGVEIKKRDDRIASHERQYADIALNVEAQTPEWTEEKYPDSTAAIGKKVDEQKKDLIQTREDLAQEKDKVASLDKQINECKKDIEAKEQEIEKQKKEVARLKKILNPDGNTEDMSSGAKNYAKLYSQIRGTVKRVDKKWGFVVLNLADKVDVKQRVGDKEVSNYLDIPVGAVITIVRNADEGEPRFIGKVVVSETDDKSVVANIKSIVPGESIENGDSAVFQKEDLNNVLRKIKTE